MIASKKWPQILRRRSDQRGSGFDQAGSEPDLLPDEDEVDLDTLSVDDLHPTGGPRRRPVVRSRKAAGRGRSPLLPVLLGAFALVCLAVGIFFGYTWFFSGGKSGKLPVVQAMDDPVKVKPENPGGLEVPYQDQLVLNQEGADGEGQPVVERLLPPPEAPQPPPREPEVVAPVQAPPEAPKADELAAAASRPIRNTQIVEAPVPDESELVVVSPPSTSEAARLTTPAKPAKPQTAKAVGTAPAKGSYVVQLGSFTSNEGSEQAWIRFQKAHPQLLGDMSLFVQKALVNERTYYRVQAGPVPNRATAMDMCAQLKARKQDCLVVKR